VIGDGVTAGEFEPTDIDVTGRVVLRATARFHHPADAVEWRNPAIEADLDAVISLLLRGLQTAGSGRDHVRKRSTTRKRA
jgi:Tetracyclin repressor-like, C-terminal domain